MKPLENFLTKHRLRARLIRGENTMTEKACGFVGDCECCPYYEYCDEWEVNRDIILIE